MKLIGIAGLAGAGKDTIADILVESRGFRKIAFSDALYLEVCKAFGCSMKTLLDRDTKESLKPDFALEECSDKDFIGVAIENGLRIGEWNSPRNIMQLWGTEYRRAQDDNYWVKKVDDVLQNSDHKLWVNPSTRFQNEADWIRKNGGEIWRVVRGGLKQYNHPSEAGFDESQIDRVFDNTGSIEDLAEQVLKVYR